MRVPCSGPPHPCVVVAATIHPDVFDVQLDISVASFCPDGPGSGLLFGNEWMYRRESRPGGLLLWRDDARGNHQRLGLDHSLFCFQDQPCCLAGGLGGRSRGLYLNNLEGFTPPDQPASESL